MLLNEFLKEHRKVEEQQATITQLKAADARLEAIIAQQQEQFQAAVAQQQSTNAEPREQLQGLRARLEEQASRIQKVSD
jgi:hypothetical protein